MLRSQDHPRNKPLAQAQEPQVPEELQALLQLEHLRHLELPWLMVDFSVVVAAIDLKVVGCF
jgi:hypothetical protein